MEGGPLGVMCTLVGGEPDTIVQAVGAGAEELDVPQAEAAAHSLSAKATHSQGALWVSRTEVTTCPGMMGILPPLQ